MKPFLRGIAALMTTAAVLFGTAASAQDKTVLVPFTTALKMFPYMAWFVPFVVEATAEIEDGPTTLGDLRRVYERIAGKPHPNWDEFDEAMIRDGRVLLALTIERMYPVD